MLIVVSIVAVIIFLIALVSFTVYDQSGVGFETVTFNNATALDVPMYGEPTSNKDEYGIYRYDDPSHNLTIISWNSIEASTISGADAKILQAESMKGGDAPTIENGIPIYYNGETSNYAIRTGDAATHDNILLISHDKDLLLKIYSTIRYGVAGAEKLNITVETNNTELNETMNNMTNLTVNNQNDNYSYYYDYGSYYDYGYQDYGYDEYSYYQ